MFVDPEFVPPPRIPKPNEPFCRNWARSAKLPLKGDNMENILICNRTSCSEPASPIGYNRVTHGLYCVICALEGHRASRDLNGGSFYPLIAAGMKPVIRAAAGGAWAPGLILVKADKKNCVRKAASHQDSS